MRSSTHSGWSTRSGWSSRARPCGIRSAGVGDARPPRRTRATACPADRASSTPVSARPAVAPMAAIRTSPSRPMPRSISTTVVAQRLRPGRRRRVGDADDVAADVARQEVVEERRDQERRGQRPEREDRCPGRRAAGPSATRSRSDHDEVEAERRRPARGPRRCGPRSTAATRPRARRAATAAPTLTPALSDGDQQRRRARVAFRTVSRFGSASGSSIAGLPRRSEAASRVILCTTRDLR